MGQNPNFKKMAIDGSNFGKFREKCLTQKIAFIVWQMFKMLRSISLRTSCQIKNMNLHDCLILNLLSITSC